MARARTRLTQEQRKTRTREAILAAAVRLFARQGVEATSLDQIAEAAGYTKGAIYGTFKDKRALVEAVIARHMVTLDFRRFLDLPLPLVDRLGHLGRAVAELRQTVPPETFALDLEYRLNVLRNPRAHRRDFESLAAESAAFRQRLAEIYAEEKSPPPFEPDQLLLLIGILARAIIQAEGDLPGRLEADAIETAFRLLAGGRTSQLPR
jgi:AcrR family transcriptional regulator